MSQDNPKRMIAAVDELRLKMESSPSDRFSYARYFVPRALPEILSYRVPMVDAFAAQLEELFDKANDLFHLFSAPRHGGSAAGGIPAFNRYAVLAERGRLPEAKGFLEGWERAKIDDARKLADELRGGRNVTRTLERLGGILAAPAMRKIMRTTADADSRVTPEPIYSIVPGGGLGGSGGGSRPIPGPDALAALLDMLKSELGWCFYDRTRIRPAGFALGEHLYTLSLAPGEEVTLEQKTFTKRQVATDEVLENEREVGLERSSTDSTEIQDSLDETYRTELKAGVSVTEGAGTTGSADVPITANVGVTAHEDITLASDEVRRHSIKRSLTRTAKLTAKQRALHKITFHVSTDTGTEASSRRVIKNPNKTTPINLQYFKILQRNEFTQERYAVRLCWAPWVIDPGHRVRLAEEAKRAAEAARAQTQARPAPVAPTQREFKWSDWGPSVKCGRDKGGFALMDAAGSMSVDINEHEHGIRAECNVPASWEWDGQNTDFQMSFPGQRSHHVRASEAATLELDKVKAGFHVGIDCTCGTAAGATMHAYDNTRCTVNEPRYMDDVAVQMRIGLIPVRTPEEESAFREYQSALLEWQAEEAKRIAELAGQVPPEPVFEPISELMCRLVESVFPREEYDDAWEVDFWHRVFEWEGASYTLYPGWWTGRPLPHPERPATDFLNASWGRLFVPIRPGQEEMALRWIVGRTLYAPLNDEWSAEVKKILDELSLYRAQFGGDAEVEMPTTGCAVAEKFVTLACWTDTLPTDGTHLEILQSMTTAGDPYTHEEIDDSNKLRNAVIAEKRADRLIKEKALEQIETVTVDLSIKSGDGE